MAPGRDVAVMVAVNKADSTMLADIDEPVNAMIGSLAIR